jgi:hypothetical protein
VDPDEPGHGIDHQCSAVERRAEPLDYAHDHEYPVSGGRADEAFHVGAIQLDGRIEVALVQVPARAGPAPDDGAEGGALRVTADERLREHRQLGATRRALGDQALCLGDGRGGVKRDRRRLNHGNTHHGSRLLR